jgi:N-acetylmuramoyl-L-alanine amidase
MARYPGATWRPLSAEYIPGRKIVEYNRVNLHVAVSEALSLHPFFNAPKRASCHFYVLKNGKVEQYIDTTYMAEADLEGNDATISIETQGGVKSPNGEPWTDAQVVALAKLFAWLVKTHGFPVRLATDSKIGPSSHGLSWHRLGIDGNFPALPSVLAGRKQRGGGMHYSLSAGKVCPGDAKIKQIPGILAMAKVILTPPVPKPAPPKPEPAKEEVPPPPVVAAPITKEKTVHVIRRGVTLPAKGKPAPKYSLVTGSRVVTISVAAAKQYKAAGVPLVGLPDADYDSIVKALTV